MVGASLGMVRAVGDSLRSHYTVLVVTSRYTWGWLGEPLGMVLDSRGSTGDAWGCYI